MNGLREDLIVELLKENRTDIKEIKEDISEMKVDVALNKDDLKVHMKRSDKLEELVEIKQAEVDAKIAAIEKKLSIGYLYKLIIAGAAGVSTVAGAIYGVLRLLGKV